MPERLLIVAKDKGLACVENAVCDMYEVLGAAAPKLIEERLRGNDKGLRVAVASLLTLALTMEKVVRARAMVAGSKPLIL